MRKSDILVNLTFWRLDKFDGRIYSGGVYADGEGRTYIRDVTWVTYLWGVLYKGILHIHGGSYIWGDVLTVFYGIFRFRELFEIIHQCW